MRLELRAEKRAFISNRFWAISQVLDLMIAGTEISIHSDSGRLICRAEVKRRSSRHVSVALSECNRSGGDYNKWSLYNKGIKNAWLNLCPI